MATIIIVLAIVFGIPMTINFVDYLSAKNSGYIKDINVPD